MKVAEHQPGAGQPDATELLRVLDAGLSPALLERALTHRSFAYENGGLPTNERLEFLGDSVLGLVVTDALFRGYPDLPEGHLAKLRAAVVNMRALASVARGLRLGDYVRLGRGEDGTGGRDKSSILADTLEAVIGAVYIERGLPEASALVHRLFDPVIARSARLGAGLDWKTSLQELTASEALGVPEYTVEESGPDHQKSFRATVRVGGYVYGTGEGRSKKEAEQQAAETAWNAISNGETPAAAGDEAAKADSAQAGPADAAGASHGAGSASHGVGGSGGGGSQDAAGTGGPAAGHGAADAGGPAAGHGAAGGGRDANHGTAGAGGPATGHGAASAGVPGAQAEAGGAGSQSGRRGARDAAGNRDTAGNAVGNREAPGNRQAGPPGPAG
jgi:ribonuclease-3